MQLALERARAFSSTFEVRAAESLREKIRERSGIFLGILRQRRAPLTRPAVEAQLHMLFASEAADAPLALAAMLR